MPCELMRLLNPLFEKIKFKKKREIFFSADGENDMLVVVFRERS